MGLKHVVFLWYLTTLEKLSIYGSVYFSNPIRTRLESIIYSYLYIQKLKHKGQIIRWS